MLPCTSMSRTMIGRLSYINKYAGDKTRELRQVRVHWSFGNVVWDRPSAQVLSSVRDLPSVIWMTRVVRGSTPSHPALVVSGEVVD